MPLEDFVSPIIKAYLAGQNIKRQREQDELRKREADDESKIRQLNAQKLAKDIQHYDKNVELENKAHEMQFKVAQRNLTKSVLDEYEAGRLDIPEKVIEAAKLAASNPEAQQMGMTGALAATPKMGLVPEIDLGDGVKISTAGFPTRAQIVANRIQRQREMLTPEIEKAQALQNVKTAAEVTLQDRLFGHQDKTLEKEQSFRSSERTGTQTWQEQMQEKRLNAQSSLAALERALKLDIVNIQRAGAKERTQMGIDAKNLFDSEEVDSTVESNIKTPLLTREGITKMGKAAENAITRKAAEKKYKIFKDADYKTLSELNQFNTIIDSMEKLSKEIGNGANVTKYTGDFTELGKQVKQLETYKPYLAKMTSVKGTQSDQDTRIAGGNLLELGGLGVAKTNRDRINAMKRIKAGTFMSFFPPGTNPEQIIEAANTFGITADDLKLLDEDQKRRKLNGGGK